MALMENKSTCTLLSSINNSNIGLSSTTSVHNGLGNKVVEVVFDVKGEEVSISSYILPNDSMNAFRNDQQFMAALL